MFSRNSLFVALTAVFTVKEPPTVDWQAKFAALE